MFLLTGLNSWEEGEQKINVKCNPEKAIELREEYEDINAGWHMSKKHWNTIAFEEGLSDTLLCELIDHSYELVVSKLKKADREFLKNL